jgi:hypothetical protein
MIRDHAEKNPKVVGEAETAEEETVDLGALTKAEKKAERAAAQQIVQSMLLEPHVGTARMQREIATAALGLGTIARYVALT